MARKRKLLPLYSLPLWPRHLTGRVDTSAPFTCGAASDGS